MPIQLSISEIREEIRHLKKAASDLLAPSAPGVLDRFERDLEMLTLTNPGHITDWQIFRDRPLVTAISKGEFCFDGKVGEHDCYAKISSIWTVTPVEPEKKKKGITAFQVVGKASVHISLFEQINDKELLLASWRMEMGASDAPGCFFHTQILGEKNRLEYPFPHSLDIPRLPSFLFTPMAVTEFVLAELFQDKWRDPTRQARPEIKAWSHIQRERLLRTFMWHLRQTQTAPGSPWMHIKSTIPQTDWFLRKDLSLKDSSSFLK